MLHRSPKRMPPSVAGSKDRKRLPVEKALHTTKPEVGSSRSAGADPSWEELFLDRLRKVSLPLLRLGDPRPDGAGTETGSRLYFRRYAEHALELEIYLDACHARSNAAFAPLREYVASLRGFARAGLHLCDVIHRSGVDLYPPPGQVGDVLLAEARTTLDFVVGSLSSLWRECASELERVLGTGLVLGHSRESLAEVAPPMFHLPATMEQVSVPEQNRRIAELAGKFLGHRKILERQGGGSRFEGVEEMRRFVLESSDEQQVRFFQTRIHNLISGYDTFVQGTAVEGHDPELPRFRAHVAMILALLEFMTELVHFYERHENDIRSETAKNRVAQIVDKALVLDRILNFALVQVHAMVRAVATLAEKLVERFTLQDRIVCTIPAGLSIHARPVHLITRIVEHHATPVTVTVGKTTCYAGSILQVLMAVGGAPDVRELTFVGDRRPLEDLKTLFEAGLGERGAGSLPRELSYLGV